MGADALIMTYMATGKITSTRKPADPSRAKAKIASSDNPTLAIAMRFFMPAVLS